MRDNTVRLNNGRRWTTQAASAQRLRVIFGAAVLLLQFATLGFSDNPAHAEPSGDAPCAERLRMFVVLIDELFARREQDDEAYYEIIRNYLPDRSCRAEEAISISQTSKFFVKPPPSEYDRKMADYVVVLKNQDLNVSFGVDKKTGRISFPAVVANGTSW
jgi:hypothetical protein